MGLGLLLCAYFLLTCMSVGIGDYCFVTYLIGAVVTLYAVEKLADYNPRFRWLYPASALYALIAIYRLLVVVSDVFLWDIPLSGALWQTAVSWAQFAAELSYSAIALWSLYELARSVGLDKHRVRTLRNLLFLGFWAVAQILLLAIPALASAGNQALVKVLFGYQLVVYLLNSFCLYTCFSAICPAGEEFGKPTKPSRFRFINELNQKLDEKNERARLEYEQKMQEEHKKYSAKNNNRHHKKKK